MPIDDEPAFHVDACGLCWTVHRLTAKGFRGTLAFTNDGETWIVGLLRLGHLSPEQVVKALEEIKAAEDKHRS